MPTTTPPHFSQPLADRTAEQPSPEPNLFHAKLPPPDYPPLDSGRPQVPRLPYRQGLNADVAHVERPDSWSVPASQSPQSYNDMVDLLRQANQQLQAMAKDSPSAPTQFNRLPHRPDNAFMPPTHGFGRPQHSPPIMVPDNAPDTVLDGAAAENIQPSSAIPSLSERQAPGSNPMTLFSWLWAGLTSRVTRNKLEPGAVTSTLPSPPPSSSSGISNIQYVVTGGCIFMALALMVDVRPFTSEAVPSDLCQQIIKPEAVLSRDHLTQMLAISERTARSNVQQVIAEPYCRLPPVSIRAGVMAEREAYPLEFDPDTWLVMLYEGEEYAGFDFSFQR